MGWDRAEVAIMGVAQGLLQRVGESMLGTMVLGGVWVEVLGAVHDMLVCAAEAETQRGQQIYM